MTILTSSYQTQAGKRHKTELEKAKQEITTYLTTGALKPSEHHPRLYLIDNEYEGLVNIPRFGSPIVMLNRATQDQIVVVDVRTFMYSASKGPIREEPRVRNVPEYTLALLRGLYTIRWIQGEATELRLVSSAPMVAYSRWLADAATRELSLDPNSQIKFRILACWYYLSQFTANSTFTYAEREKYKAMIARETSIPAQTVFSVIVDKDPFESLEDFIEAVKVELDSVRLKSFNGGILISMVTRTFFGSNALYYVPGAIEFPPDWMAMVAACARDTYFKRTIVFNVVEAAAGRRGLSDLAQAMTVASGSTLL